MGGAAGWGMGSFEWRGCGSGAVLSVTWQRCSATAGGPARGGGRGADERGSRSRKGTSCLPPACGRDSDIRYQHAGLVLKDNSNLVDAWNGGEWDALQRVAPSRHNELNVTGVTLLFPPPS